MANKPNKYHGILGRIKKSKEREMGMGMVEKKTYYIEISSGEISQSATSSPWNYKIEATAEEIKSLRKYFDANEADDVSNFFRAHIPFREYHHDQENDNQDEDLKQIYQFIYEHGDHETKQQIESMGILNTND